MTEAKFIYLLSIDDFPQERSFVTEEEALVRANEAMDIGEAESSVSIVAKEKVAPDTWRIIDTKRWHKNARGEWVVG